jgi:hypothetical protein
VLRGGTPALPLLAQKKGLSPRYAAGKPSIFRFLSAQQADGAPILISLGSPHVVNRLKLKLKLKFAFETFDITITRFTPLYLQQ